MSTTFFDALSGYRKKNPIFPPWLVMCLIVGAFLLAIFVNEYSGRKYVVVQLHSGECRGESQIDVEDLKIRVQTVKTEIHITSHQFVINEAGCVTEVRFRFEALPPVMDSLTSGGK